MYIHFGEGLYGKVDQVPGLFYVATRFWQLQFIPLLPVGSFVIVEGTESDENFTGTRIGLSFKSILMAWVRTALLIGGPVILVIGCFEANKPNHDMSHVMGLLCTGVCFLITLWFSYRLTRAGVNRALELADELRIPPERVAEAFHKVGLAPKTEDQN